MENFAKNVPLKWEYKEKRANDLGELKKRVKFALIE